MAGISNSGISSEPTSAKALDDKVPPGYQLAEKLRIYTRDSEAGKYYRGEKGFWQSVLDATRAHSDENRRIAKEKKDDHWRQQYELTPEKLKAYGIRNLDDIRRRAGR